MGRLGDREKGRKEKREREMGRKTREEEVRKSEEVNGR